MARTKHPEGRNPNSKPNKDYNGPFPLQDDPLFLSLTRNQQRFVYNVFLQPVSGWTNVKCYTEAHDIEVSNSANVCASQSLRHPKVQACIKHLRLSHTEALGFNAERIIQEVGALATSDIADFFDSDGYLIVDPTTLPSVARKAISGLTKSYDQEGQPRWKVSLWSKPEALKMMMSINGMGAAKRIELSGPAGGPIQHEVSGNISHGLGKLPTEDLTALLEIVTKIANAGGDDDT